MTVMDNLRLDGKVALVTGAGRGIGEGLAVAFAEAGADVALVSRTTAELEAVAGRIRTTGRRACVIPADVGDLSQHDSIVNAAKGELGKIDILANAAGVTRRVPVIDAKLDDWDYIFNVNLRGVYFLTQAVGRLMVEQKSGKIINIASMNSYRGFADISIYGMTKAAIVILTKTLAVEWAPYNIQANAIAPGWIDTWMTSSMNPDRREWVEAHLPQGHFGTPEDLAGLAVYFASKASDYMTGQVVAVDGGFTAGNPWFKVGGASRS